MGEASEIEWIGDQVKKVLPGSKIIVLKVDLLSNFNIYSQAIDKIDLGKPGDLLAWNINYWAWDERAHNITIDKTDGGIRYLVLPPPLNFQEAVSCIKFMCNTLHNVSCMSHLLSIAITVCTFSVLTLLLIAYFILTHSQLHMFARFANSSVNSGGIQRGN